MSEPEQDVLPNFPEAIARAEQTGLDVTCCQMHLAREFIRYGKYAKFSKDPEFKKRMLAQQIEISKMMSRAGR